MDRKYGGEHLEEKKNRRIAVFGNAWSNEFVKLVLEGIRKAAEKDGADVFAFLTYIYPSEDESASRGKLSIVEHADLSMFDGAIILANTLNSKAEQETVVNCFQKAKLPMVSTEVKLPGMAFVGTGNYEGFYELSNHLLDEHGVKKIVYMSGIKGNEECAIRKRALTDALSEHGLELYDTLSGDFSFYTATNLIKEWAASQKAWPDAFVCANDHMALGVSAQLHKLGVDVPKDVIVTGFDCVSECSSAFPIISTVSRRWDLLGEYAYEQLVKQMENLDPSYEMVYPSEFIPSESCGCKPSDEQVAYRLEKIRNSYLMTNNTSIMDIYFQNLRLYLLRVETDDDFYEAFSRDQNFDFFLGNDCYICVEPEYMETDDEHYFKKHTGFSKNLRVLYGKCEGQHVRPFTFDSKMFLPEYHKEERSNLYTIVPLGTGETTIGYFIQQNSPNMIYDLSLRKWVSNMETLFATIRQYIFSQRINRKLTEVYMTDFLTGMYNRTGCENVLFRFIESERALGRNTILLFADIDYMKHINDRYGHLNGDMALKATADAMKRSLPGGWLFGRYGGDEFVAVGSCPDRLGTEMKDMLDASIRKYIESYNLSFELSVSVGYRIITPGDEGTIEDYIRTADESMYEAKELAHKRIENGGEKFTPYGM